jgi:SAM-dependent methyltransferase
MDDGKVYRCRNCEVAFIYPMMTDQEEERFYSNYNVHAKRRGVISSTQTYELHRKSRPIAKERWELLKNFFEKGKKVLEIGSSTGAFLELCSENECVGVEPAKTNRAFSRRFSGSVYGDLGEIPENVEFDIICMFHVFEHLRTPDMYLSKCKDLLEREGHIIVEVPHIDDPLLSIYNVREFRDFYFQPMHPFVYSLKGLRYIFEKSGFEEVKAIFYQRYGLDNHLAWLSKGKPGGDAYLEALFGENRAYKEALVNSRKTDTVFYIAKRAYPSIRES